MTIKAVIIDDEEKARGAIKNTIRFNCPHVQVIGEADSVSTGIEVIKKTSPDLVLLDVQIKEGTGFDILNHFQTIPFKIVFISGYDQYAVQAFKFCALDYILKPIDPDEFKTAVEKVEDALDKENIKLKLKAYLSNINTSSKDLKKLVLKTSDSIYLVDIEDIIRCEADKNYTYLFLKDNRKITVAKTLKEYEELLHQYGFFRLHHSHLINIKYMERYDKKGDLLVLKDKSMVPVAVRKKDELFKLIESM
jgi:two-component system, LytTR family, response regulator